MMMFEYTRKENFNKLTPDQQHFVAKIMKRDTDKIAKEHGISPQEAYEWYRRGLFGGDRELGEF